MIHSAAIAASASRSNRIDSLLASHPYAAIRDELERAMLFNWLCFLDHTTLLGSMNPWQYKNNPLDPLRSCSNLNLEILSDLVTLRVLIERNPSVFLRTLVRIRAHLTAHVLVYGFLAADLVIQSNEFLQLKDGIGSLNRSGSSLTSRLSVIQISPLFLSLLCVLVFLELLQFCLFRIGWIYLILWFILWSNSFCRYMRCSHYSYLSTIWLVSQLLIMFLVVLGARNCTWIVWDL